MKFHPSIYLYNKVALIVLACDVITADLLTCYILQSTVDNLRGCSGYLKHNYVCKYIFLNNLIHNITAKLENNYYLCSEKRRNPTDVAVFLRFCASLAGKTD